MEKSGPDFNISLNSKRIFAVTFASWTLLIVLSVFTGQNFLNGLNLFNTSEGYSFVRYLLEISLYVCGTFLVFILPGLVWNSGFIRRNVSLSELLFISFLTSFTIFILITTIYKACIPSALDGANFLVMVILMTLSGLLWLVVAKKNSLYTVKLAKNHLMVCLMLIGLTVICCWIFQDKVLWVNFNQNFSSEYVLSLPLGAQDDLMEHFGLVDSLKRYLLPFWDLEYVDKFGYSVIDPPLHTFASLFLFLFFGQSFAVQSLNTIIVILTSYLLILRMSELGLRGKFHSLVNYLIPALFLSYFLVVLSHKESAIVLCDHIHFMYFFAIAQFYFLLKKRHGLFLIFALLAFLSKYEAAMFTLLGLAFYQRIYKPNKMEVGALLKKYLCLVSPLILLMVVIGLLRQDLGAYIEAISVERFMRLDYFGLLDKIYPQSRSLWGAFSIPATLEFIKQFLLATGFLGIFIFFPQKDKMSQLLKGISLVYFFLIIISREKRLHYISPLVILSVIIALRFLLQVPLGRSKKEGS